MGTYAAAVTALKRPSFTRDSLGIQPAYGIAKKASFNMPSNAILYEARQLHNISERLDALAEQFPLISETLITISGNVRHIATLLEVLVVAKIDPIPGTGPANA